MRKICIIIMTTMFGLLLNAQDIQLIAPQKDGGMPLMEALAKRQTNRSFTQQELSPQQLSNLLWAASGVNRPDGKRTAPTARNAQEIDIYILNKEGAYIYLPNEHILKLIAKGDHRKSGASQANFQECPLMIIYVANYDKMKDFPEEAKTIYGGTDTGNICQNVYLYCASEGLATCELGGIHHDKLKELLKFNGKAILGQSVGIAK